VRQSFAQSVRRSRITAPSRLMRRGHVGRLSTYGLALA
jgi:hypothetical protein